MSDTAEKMGLQGGGVSTGVSGSGQITTSNATAANAAGTTGAILASAGDISGGVIQARTGFGLGALPTATSPVFINVSQNALTALEAFNNNGGAAAGAQLYLTNNTDGTQVQQLGTAFSTNGVLVAHAGGIQTSSSAGLYIAANQASAPVVFASGGLTQRGQISSGGIWTLGPTSNPAANTFAPPIIYGRNNAAADNAGAIGETITSTVSGVAMGSTTITANVTSISPTAGKWLMWGMVVFHGGTTGFTSGSTLQASVGVATAGTGTSGQNMVQESVLVLLASGLFALTLMPFVANISATTAQFLTAVGAYVAGSPTVDGTIFAERIA